MDKNDSELVEKAKAGDTASFEALVKKYQDKIYGLANYVCMGLKSEADDVYQETFINAFKNISKFKGNSGFGTWLYRIAANNCWMKYRKRKSEKLVSMEDLTELKDLTHADEVIKQELSSSVAKALSKLSVDYRLAITLADIQGLTMEEAARVLKITVPAFKTRLFRARQALKKEYVE
ncbi:MAG: RNA polymerase subunit sigma [Elusimicrobia bacterium HGW-Elusimicrobia-3]|jgi:RNA polymerase sigma-70 factor (ECF subfamily)|nr:MAG: RNA polymerase subunit sigma [Elusimicrobia bacterium HGW-Elusimicrobia-3]